MIHWCAYCQSYLGEVPPWTDYRMSHGICPSCLSTLKSKDGDEIERRAKRLSAFFESVREAAFSSSSADGVGLIGQARAVGIKPLDLAFGILQPILNELGSSWAEGSVTVATEHRFSAFAEATLPRIAAEYPEISAYRQSPSPLVLLAVAEGNYHSLGVRFLELLLCSRSIPVLALVPGLPPGDLLELVERHRPKVVGLSVAMETQLGSVRQAAAGIAALPEARRPVLVVGGDTVRRGVDFRPEFRIETAMDLNGLSRFIPGAGDGA